MRLEERLVIRRSLEPAALQGRIPPMLVQTLVENGVKHGISRRMDGGELDLSARVAGSQLVVVVANTGSFHRRGAESGSGLRNARERLRLIYDGRASLTLQNESDRVIATLTLPWRSSPVQDAVPGLARNGV